MLQFMLRRLAQSAVVVAAILSLVFFTGHTLGDPAKISLPITATEEQVEIRREQLGLNQPLLVQYGRFMRAAVTGDFGDSLWYKVPAIEMAFKRLGPTLLLTAATLVLAVPFALLLGSLAAMRPKSRLDRAVNVLSLGSVSVVEFWLALMLILFFAVQLGVLPTSGYGGWQYIILPAVTLAFRPFGRLAQVTRSTMSTELARPYVKVARAKGVQKARRVSHHALKNAAIPLLTLSGDEAIALLSGAVIVETIFAWPGVGQLLIQAIQQRDLALLEATVFMVAVLIALVNIMVDVAYAYLNPRVELT